MNGRLMTPSNSNSRELASRYHTCRRLFGDAERIRQIVAEFGNDAAIINDSAEFGLTPLLLAALRKHSEVVNLLLGAPAIDVNAKVPDGYFKAAPHCILPPLHLIAPWSAP